MMRFVSGEEVIPRGGSLVVPRVFLAPINFPPQPDRSRQKIGWRHFLSEKRERFLLVSRKRGPQYSPISRKCGVRERSASACEREVLDAPLLAH